MSVFGDHTLKQDLLEGIEECVYEHKPNLYVLLRALMEVIEHIISVYQFYEENPDEKRRFPFG